MELAINWSALMLKKLSLRLQVIFIIAIMCVITVVIAIFSFSQYQSEAASDKNYTEKMASFFVLELETELIPPERVLMNWGASEGAAILKDLYTWATNMPSMTILPSLAISVLTLQSVSSVK